KFTPTLMSMQAAMDQMDVAGTASMGQTAQALQQQMDGKPIQDLNRQVPLQVTGMTNTDTTMTASLGNNQGSFNADFSQKTLQMEQDGNQIAFQLGDDPTMTYNGSEVSVPRGEMDALGMMFQILELFHTMGVESRQIAREARNATNEGVVKNIQEQAGKQRDAAQKQRIAGMASGAAKVGSAMASGYGAAKGMRADAAAAQNAQPGQVPNFQGNMISQRYSAVGSMFEGGAEMGASQARYLASQDEADQTMLRGGEEQLKHIKQTEQDQMQAGQDLLSKAREAYSQIMMQNIQTAQSLAKNI
ncbi:MAG: hypothetical protein OXD32_07480, partial [Endozoicomonadaceae bacterium]|nr:hypothetical protein [Endozoicomonadaceae bacterium]